MSIILEGHRSPHDGSVYLVEKDTQGAVAINGPSASIEISNELFKEVCSGCPAFKSSCDGVDKISPWGNVIAKGEGGPVKNQSCQIPGKTITVLSSFIKVFNYK